ncbi:hypothetical protein DF286_04075 [Sphingosinicella humi]|uniref:Uncharacterized protein n=1 Tax=Allosphingosinicella humi TaxID=2068657 RepID=A0A2U2J1D4_9SPHN|nr:hypothetical protein DF286_04075 [Sphingosinicella humi]
MADEGAKARAFKAGLEAWAAGDIVLAGRTKDGGPGFKWRDEATKQRVKPLILPAWTEVWEAVVALAQRAAAKAAEIESEAKQKASDLVDTVTEAVKTFMARYNAVPEVERDTLRRTPAFEAVATLANDPAVRATVADSEDNEVDLLLQAAAAGLVKGVKVSGSGAVRKL